MMSDDWMHYGWGGMWLVHVVWFALLGAAVWFALQRLRRNNQPPDAESSEAAAKRILDARFAKSEIDKTEYDARRSALSH
jgi:uncharacterized membrane protein